MNLQSFLIGLAIGLVSAIIGGLVEYLIVRQRGDSAQETERLPGCMLLVTGGLGGLGLLAIGFSLLTSGEVVRMLITGLGVGVGFFGGFLVMMLGWFLINRPGGEK
jgi:ABC-type Fe3+ transport system permease subunit